jgi:hypothetical protein
MLFCRVTKNSYGAISALAARQVRQNWNLIWPLMSKGRTYSWGRAVSFVAISTFLPLDKKVLFNEGKGTSVLPSELGSMKQDKPFSLGISAGRPVAR